MHQVFSCSDDRLHVFTTVLSPKSELVVAGSPTRNTQSDFKQVRHKMVVAECNYYPHWSDELVLCQGDVIQVLYKDDEVWWFGRLENGQQGYFPSTYVSKYKENYGQVKNNNTKENSVKKADIRQPVGSPQIPSGTHKAVRRSTSMFEKSQALPGIHASFRPGLKTLIPEPSPDVSPSARGQNGKDTKQYPVLDLGPDATASLTGNPPNTTRSILGRIIMKSKKKSPCSGATNNAFEPD